MQERASDKHPAIRLLCDSPYTAAGCSGSGIEAGIQIATGVEPGNAVAAGRVDGSEVSTDQNFAIGLECDSGHSSARTRTGLKTAIQTAIAIEPGDAFAAGAVNLGKIAADQ